MDVSSLANRCVQLEASNAALLSENERLREQLQQSTERSAKMRKRYERCACRLMSSGYRMLGVNSGHRSL